jgi:hypothetical protein
MSRYSERMIVIFLEYNSTRVEVVDLDMRGIALTKSNNSS